MALARYSIQKCDQNILCNLNIDLDEREILASLHQGEVAVVDTFDIRYVTAFSDSTIRRLKMLKMMTMITTLFRNVGQRMISEAASFNRTTKMKGILQRKKNSCIGQ